MPMSALASPFGDLALARPCLRPLVEDSADGVSWDLTSRSLSAQAAISAAYGAVTGTFSWQIFLAPPAASSRPLTPDLNTALTRRRSTRAVRGRLRPLAGELTSGRRPPLRDLLPWRGYDLFEPHEVVTMTTLTRTIGVSMCLSFRSGGQAHHRGEAINPRPFLSVEGDGDLPMLTTPLRPDPPEGKPPATH
jgi:hypothetical protein